MSAMLACRFGLHSWFTDSALIHSAKRCNYCDKVQSKRDVELLDAERRRIASLPKGAGLADMYLAAADIRLHSPERIPGRPGFLS